MSIVNYYSCNMCRVTLGRASTCKAMDQISSWNTKAGRSTFQFLKNTLISFNDSILCYALLTGITRHIWHCLLKSLAFYNWNSCALLLPGAENCRGISSHHSPAPFLLYLRAAKKANISKTFYPRQHCPPCCCCWCPCNGALPRFAFWVISSSLSA